MAFCEHFNFDASVEVNRLEDVGKFQAGIRIVCRDCGQPFRFLGLPMGVDLAGATTNGDATEARMAIAPKDESCSGLEGPAGFAIRKPLN
jgi:hypothetical protein